VFFNPLLIVITWAFDHQGVEDYVVEQINLKTTEIN
jgi:hypothetical protein